MPETLVMVWRSSGMFGQPVCRCTVLALWGSLSLDCSFQVLMGSFKAALMEEIATVSPLQTRRRCSAIMPPVLLSLP